MKLKEACDIGYACGLSTVDEAILNVEIHCSNIFSYADATLELYELHEEAKPYLNKNKHILELFPELREKEDDFIVCTDSEISESEW